MKRFCLTAFLLIAAFALTGCSSVMMLGSTESSLLDHLAVRGTQLGGDPAEDKSLEIDFGLARVAERNGRGDQAVQAYEKILTKYPGYAPALHRMGVIAAKHGRLEEAMAMLLKANQSEKPSAQLLGDIGYAQFLAEDYEAATHTLQKAVRLAPDDERIINNLAIVLGMQQQYSDSLELFRQAGSEAESLAGVAYVQSQTGQLEQAKSAYHRSLDIDPSLAIAANGLLELEHYAESKEVPSTSAAVVNNSSYRDAENERKTEPSNLGQPQAIHLPSLSVPSNGVMKSLANAFQGRAGLTKRSEGNGRLVKPPVRTVADLTHSIETGAPQNDRVHSAAEREMGMSNDPANRTTARIVMTDVAARAVSEAPRTQGRYASDKNADEHGAIRLPTSRRDHGVSAPAVH